MIFNVIFLIFLPFLRDHSGHLLVGCEDHVCQNVILNLSPGIPRDIVGIMMSVGIILSYILILAPAREHIERIILR
jgi:prolipoprotein diacylglyceryltransferase